MKIKKVDDKIRRHYEVEKELSCKLKQSSWEERILIYKTLYDELFKKVPWHPRLVAKHDEGVNRLILQQQLEILNDFIDKESVFLEIGPGDCSLAIKLAEMVKKVYAVDISDKLLKVIKSLPENFQFKLSDGRSVDVPNDSVDVAFSNQVIEHFHPDDVIWHIRNVKNVLKPGGVYIILTPHRFKGPCDISQYFDQEATGLHLKEWIFSELMDIFKMHGYKKSTVYFLIRGVRFYIPNILIKASEYFLGKLPYYPRKKMTGLIFRGRCFIVAKK